MVSIVLVSYNEGQLTKNCVDSIRQNVTLPYEIIVVDNQSKPETLAVLEQIPDILLIKNNRNAGFPAGCNSGLAVAAGDLVWFLNNDTIVPPGSLERMAELLMSDDTIGMVGPVTNRINGVQQIPVDYTEDAGILPFAARIRREYANQTQRMIRLVGFSMLMRKATLDELGGLDERMGIGTFEDDDLSLRLVAHEYRLLVARDAFIHHIGNASFTAAGGYPSTGPQNQNIASTTFGMTIPTETVLNEPLLKRLAPDAKKVLQVECGAGAFGLWAQEQGMTVVGFESSAKKHVIARNHYTACHLYQQGGPIDFDDTGYDTLLIEKQRNDRDALLILQSLRPALNSDARILVQFPFLTAQNGDVYTTFYDGWTEDGFVAKTGELDLLHFLHALNELNLSLRHVSIEEVRTGFFNRCSFDRFRQSVTIEEGHAFPFFRCCMVDLRTL